jgi:MraZ protein
LAFRGTFDHTLDAKNRLTVPSRFRATLADGVVLAKPIDGVRCVELWVPEGYDAYSAEALHERNPARPETRQLGRFFAANSFDTELDSAGRVMLPHFLIEDAELTREVVVTGAGDHLEVWDRASWAAYNDDLSSRVPEIAASLGHPA